MRKSTLDLIEKESVSKRTRILFIALYDEYALGLRILASILIKAGYEVKIVVFKQFCVGLRQKPTSTEWQLFASELKKFKPDLIGISMLSLHLIDEDKLIRFVRNCVPEATVMLGGFGPTLEPRKFLDFGPDFIVIGEGEKTVLEIVEAMENKQDLGSLNNTAWLKNGKLIRNKLYPLIDLGGLPFAYYGDENIAFIENDICRKVDPLLSLKGIYMTNTSRGCTGRCTYCAGGNWLDLYKNEHGKCVRYRKRPVNEVIDECVRAKDLGATYIIFMDEYFVRPEKEYYLFFEEYRNQIGLPFGLMVHTAFMEKDRARFDVFFQAGINNVEIGIQSASPYVAQEIYNRKVHLDTQVKTIQLLYENWVSTQVDFITGHSLESEQEFLKTVEFVRSLPFDPLWPERCHIAPFSLAILPGAIIGDLHPELLSNPMPDREKQFRLRILYIRHVLKDDDEFNVIYRNRFFRHKPVLLKYVFNDLFNRLYSLSLAAQLEKLKGKEVYFYGVGECYEMHKHLFRNIRPKAILVDKGDAPMLKDGIKIVRPEDELSKKTENVIPIVLFSYTPGIMATKILRNYPRFNYFIPCFSASYPQYFLA